MLSEFRPQRFSHDLILRTFPILSQRTLTAAAHAGSNHGRFCNPDLLFMFSSSKLLCLKVVLRCWPLLSVQLKCVRGEVREFAKRLIYSVKKNSFHCASSFLNSAIT